MSSVYNMARGVASSLGATIKGFALPAAGMGRQGTALGRPRAVPVAGHRRSLVCGRLNEQQAITIESEMPTDGVIFSDGVETDFLEFNSGAIARIGIADQRQAGRERSSAVIRSTRLSHAMQLPDRATGVSLNPGSGNFSGRNVSTRRFAFSLKVSRPKGVTASLDCGPAAPIGDTV